MLRIGGRRGSTLFTRERRGWEDSPGDCSGVLRGDRSARERRSCEGPPGDRSSLAVVRRISKGLPGAWLGCAHGWEGPPGGAWHGCAHGWKGPPGDDRCAHGCDGASQVGHGPPASQVGHGCAHDWKDLPADITRTLGMGNHRNEETLGSNPRIRVMCPSRLSLGRGPCACCRGAITWAVIGSLT